MPHTALLVIDAQESFRHRPYWQEGLAPAFFAALNRLIEGARATHVPIVRILHVEPEGAFSFASGWVRPMQEVVRYDPAVEFQKSRHSALVGTGLETWLIQNGIRRLIVSGVRTEQCCETTARHASDLGFEVDYVTDATLTFDMMHAAREIRVSADDIKLRTELVLAGRFATICTVEEALRRTG
jgi:nicotinamidase-related amidase